MTQRITDNNKRYAGLEYIEKKKDYRDMRSRLRMLYSSKAFFSFGAVFLKVIVLYFILSPNLASYMLAVSPMFRISSLIAAVAALAYSAYELHTAKTNRASRRAAVAENVLLVVAALVVMTVSFTAAIVTTSMVSTFATGFALAFTLGKTLYHGYKAIKSQDKEKKQHHRKEAMMGVKMLVLVAAIYFLVGLNKFAHIAVSVTVGVVCAAVGVAVLVGVWKKYKAERAQLKAAKPEPALIADVEPSTTKSVYDVLLKPKPVVHKAPIIDTADKLITFIDTSVRSIRARSPIPAGMDGIKIEAFSAIKTMLATPSGGRVDALGETYEWHSQKEMRAGLFAMCNKAREQGLLESAFGTQRKNAMRFALESALYKVPLVEGASRVTAEGEALRI